jgi:hypothetical protein
MKKAMFIHGGALGDFILSLRVVQAMQENGFGSVDILARGANLPLLPLFGIAGKGLDIDCGGFHDFFSTGAECSVKHREMLRGYELVVSMLPATGLRGTLNELNVEYIEIDPVARKNSALHITSQWMAHLPVDWTIVPEVTRSLFTVDEMIRNRGRLILGRVGSNERVIVLHPGSGGRAKCYPLKYFRELATLLSSESLNPVFVVGEVELELLSEPDLVELHAKYSLLKQLSLIDLASVLSLADCYTS